MISISWRDKLDLIPIDVPTALGASILTRRGSSIPCFVATPSGLQLCTFLYLSNGGVMICRQSDGRESNFPLAYASVLMDQETAGRCRQAEEERQREVKGIAVRFNL